MDKTTQLEKRIIELEKQMRDLQNSSTIPLNVDKSFAGRGFLKADTVLYIDARDYSYLSDTFISGDTQLGIPTGFVKMQGDKLQDLLIPVYLQPRTF